MAKKQPFWNRVARCRHRNVSRDYLQVFTCGTPYCEGQETHCLDCGVFIGKCGCGNNDNMSGWSLARWAKKHRNG